MRLGRLFRRSASGWVEKMLTRGQRPPTPPTDPPPASAAAGAVSVGKTTYRVPTANVLYVSTTGSDANPGTSVYTPLATLAAAVSRVTTAGTTIIVRGGTYHEGNIEAGGKPAFAIQSYPGEAVWFDGTSVLTSTWTAGTGTWSAPYALTFDRNMGKGVAWGGSLWTGSAYRNVVDQVWLDNTRLTPVADNSTPGPGQFSVNQSTHTLTIGSDPTGKVVRVADLNFLIAATTLTLRGIGIRRYATAMVEWRGAVVMVNTRSFLENVVVEHASVDAISMGGPDVVIRKCTVQDTGHSGIMGDNAANGLVELNLIRRCNRLFYDPEPTTAGFKMTRVFAGLTIRDNHIEDVVNGSGIWLDTTVSRTKIHGNTIVGTSAFGAAGRMKSGISIECSDGGFYGGTQYFTYIVGNYVSGCRISGVILCDSGWIKVHNNRISSAVAVYLWQEERQNLGAKVATEGTPEQSPWHCTDIEVVNNIVIPEATYNTQLRCQVNSGATYKTTGGAMLSALRGNWFRPQGSGLFAYMFDVNATARNASTLSALAALPTSYGGPLDPPRMANNVQQDTAPADLIADPMPTDVADVYGVPPYQQKVGPLKPPVVLETA